ncbi:MAG: phenylacetate--CoA ligase, partial [Clostridiales bacterium]|nr:phenylacetate--CoA ligase [Clostridiales bacterium]
GMSCAHECGIHYWDDYLYFEIIDPKTGKVLPDGEVGELVITTLTKEGAPLIRYRTHDLTKIIPGECACGSPYPRIDTLTGRTDDMVKVKGVNIYPGQIEDAIRGIEGVSSEYQVMIDHLGGKDIMTLFFETLPQVDMKAVEAEVKINFKTQVGLSIVPKGVAIGELPRSEKKTKRIFDNRY